MLPHALRTHSDFHTTICMRCKGNDKSIVHISIWEPCSWFPLEVPQNCLEHAQPQKTHGVEQLGLTLEDKFLLQVLHVCSATRSVPGSVSPGFANLKNAPNKHQLKMKRYGIA